mgnify:CR=1 FL=1
MHWSIDLKRCAIQHDLGGHFFDTLSLFSEQLFLRKLVPEQRGSRPPKYRLCP